VQKDKVRRELFENLINTLFSFLFFCGFGYLEHFGFELNRQKKLLKDNYFKKGTQFGG